MLYLRVFAGLSIIQVLEIQKIGFFAEGQTLGPESYCPPANEGKAAGTGNVVQTHPLNRQAAHNTAVAQAANDHNKLLQTQKHNKKILLGYEAKQGTWTGSS